MILDFDYLHSTLTREKDREKNQVLKKLFETPDITRKKIIQELSLRPTTVSRIVAELIEDDIIREDHNKANIGRGRPELFLTVNGNRFWTVSFSIISMSLRGAIINLKGEILKETVIKLDIDTNTVEMLDIFNDVVKDFHSQMPLSSKFIGFGFALPGLIDKDKKIWRMVSRFPKLKKMDLKELEGGRDSIIIIERNIDSLLKNSLLKRPESAKGTTLLIHWGYGIAVSCAMEGRILQSPNGLFGEIGHWDMNIPQSEDCSTLESIAALSGMLKCNGWNEGIDEEVIVGLIRDNIFPEENLKAINDMILGIIKNLYLTFFPDKIYILSAFVSSKLSKQLELKLKEQLPDFVESTPSIQTLDYVEKGESLGIANSVFNQAIEHYLTARW
ncbi:MULTISPECIES: ROK family transcriptional regulator [unclassified Oceanispirochaeta]|uniref:ROK family transcriptional regulator n=1 Tax=unclassified Oceanispirochaeta TaxID=2635722 RepID=UPI000E091BCC|nr:MULTISPECIES: ROK family transcriptional regulator [unclassified Oceanispirochaeta]MBF9018559.1 ROK family transcriptional regulator [Oceanispirochaeta sp. M2]NPD74967.1 ROK family transcriptional regulator [Oceanispirochaeta sp. M1]RDG29198.1 ROK family transcriptional regulator [Oceanispirochaeta sp. M1]